MKLKYILFFLMPWVSREPKASRLDPLVMPSLSICNIGHIGVALAIISAFLLLLLILYSEIKWLFWIALIVGIATIVCFRIHEHQSRTNSAIIAPKMIENKATDGYDNAPHSEFDLYAFHYYSFPGQFTQVVKVLVAQGLKWFGALPPFYFYRHNDFVNWRVYESS